VFSAGNVLLSEVDEARLLLETADRARKHAEADVNDVRDAMANVSTANSLISMEKRRLEGDLRGMQQELDNYMSQIKNSEEKMRKAIADASMQIFISLLLCLWRNI
jgi:myosin heavy chain 6/7